MKIKLNREIDFVIRAFLAGLMIAIGAITYLYLTAISDEIIIKFVGAFMFCLGLVFIILLEFKLFTGMNASLMEMSWIEYYRLPLCFIFNALGCWLGALLIFKTPIGEIIIAKSIELTNTKLTMNLGYAFLSAILCGILITLAVLGYRVTRERSLGVGVFAIIFPIMAFVLIGVEHSVANQVYFALACLGGNGFPASIILQTFIVMLGNIVGGIFIPLLVKYVPKNISHAK